MGRLVMDIYQLVPEDEIINQFTFIKNEPAKKICSDEKKEMWMEILGYDEDDFLVDDYVNIMNVLEFHNCVLTKKALYIDISSEYSSNFKCIPCSKISSVSICSDNSYEQIKYGICIEYDGKEITIWGDVSNCIDEDILNSDFEENEEFDNEEAYVENLLEEMNRDIFKLYIDLCNAIA